MTSVAPPFTNLTTVAAAVTEKVRDSKGGFVDSDFVVEALRLLSEIHPAWATVDVGDGSTREWITGAGGSLTAWVPGFSEMGKVELEELSAADTPGNPPRIKVKDQDWWFDHRTVSSASRLYIVLRDAPGTSLLRIRFPIRWVATTAASSLTLPDHLHMALVYKACELKCGALGSFYRSTVDAAGGSDTFEAEPVSASYFRAAGHWRGEYERATQQLVTSQLTTGIVRPRRMRVFP